MTQNAKLAGKKRRDFEALDRSIWELEWIMGLLGLLFLLALGVLAVVYHPIVCLSIVGALVSLGVVVFLRVRWNWKETSPPIPHCCPSCGSERLKMKSSGLWDGEDNSGKGIGGGFHYALCEQCGSRCAQYVDGRPYVPSEDEWRQHFEPSERFAREAEQWPFMDGAGPAGTGPLQCTQSEANS